jgi:AcrR family transcriptional regulator
VQIFSMCKNFGVTDGGDRECGLRERKKRATRQALGEAALRLAADRGLEHLTVEEISEAAGVSARTFFNYFSSKEEAIIGDGPLITPPGDGVPFIGDGESVLDGLHRVVRAAAAGTAWRRDEVQVRRQLLQRYPALVPRMYARIAGFERSLASAVATRSGGSAGDAYPQLMAAVASTAARVAIYRWGADHGDRTLDHHLDEMFGLLKAGSGPDGETFAGKHSLVPHNGTFGASRADQDSTQEGRV